MYKFKANEEQIEGTKGKILIKFMILSIIIMMLTVGCSSKTSYQKKVTSFTPISVNEVYDKIENKTPFVLYISKESCPFCVEVTNNIRSAAKEIGIKIFYIDADDADIKNNEIFLGFKKEYNAETDPTMLLFTENDYSKARLITDTDEIAFIFRKYLNRL